MNQPSKILWQEGLTLRPQQFQQQDHHHENRLHRTATAIAPHLWGVRAVEWNADGLQNNTLRADSMSLIFQDGELYDAPGADQLPSPVDLSTLPSAEDSFTFYAALPLLKPYGGNLGDGARFKGGARFLQIARDTPDLYSDALSAEVGYLTKAVHLLTQTAPLASFVHFPVVRIRRQSSGGFALDPDFMAPSLAIVAAPALARQLDNLMLKLKAKLDALYVHQRQPSKDTVEVQSGDISSFWLLHTISAACASLGHFAHCKALHPERLFLQLLALAGGLTTFSRKYALADLPQYEHALPGPAFAQLDRIVRDLVDTVISSKYFAIALTQDAERPSLHTGTLPVDRIDARTMLLLCVRADMPAVELIAAVPMRLKVGAPDDVERAVLSALPGVTLLHMPHVPSAVPVRPNTHYFSLEGKGTLYDNLLKAQAVAVYVPSGIAGLQLELIAVTT